MKRHKRFILAAFVVSTLLLCTVAGFFLSIWYGPTISDATSSLQQTRAFTTVSGWLGHEHDGNATSDRKLDIAVEEPAASSNQQRSNLQRPDNNNQQNQRNHHRSLLASDTYRDRNARFEHPWSDGAPTHPCQEGAIFRRYAFTARDNGKLIKIAPTGNPTFPLKVLVDGLVRTLATVTKYNFAGAWGGVDLRDLPLNVPFSLCGIETDNYLDSDANSFVGVATAGCTQLYFNDQSNNDNTDNAGNKDIVFDMASTVDQSKAEEVTASSHHFLILPAEEDSNELLVPSNKGQYAALGRSPAVQEIVLTKQITTPICSTIGLTGKPTLEPVFLIWDGAFWIHDPRFILRENTPRNYANNGKDTHLVSYRALLAFIVLFWMVPVV